MSGDKEKERGEWKKRRGGREARGRGLNLISEECI